MPGRATSSTLPLVLLAVIIFALLVTPLAVRGLDGGIAKRWAVVREVCALPATIPTPTTTNTDSIVRSLKPLLDQCLINQRDLVAKKGAELRDARGDAAISDAYAAHSAESTRLNKLEQSLLRLGVDVFATPSQ